jgi:hypothetical protein
MSRTLIQWVWLAHTGTRGVTVVAEINYFKKR